MGIRIFSGLLLISASAFSAGSFVIPFGSMRPLTFTSLGILVGLTIVFATLWGIYRKEWKGASWKPYILVVLSMVIIVLSAYLIGISGSL